MKLTLPLFALGCAITTSAIAGPVELQQNYSYVSVGYQYSLFSEYLPTDINSSYDNMSGYYARASINPVDQFFLEGRYDDVSRDRLGFSHSLVGLGYYMPVGKNSSVYALLGAEKLTAEMDLFSNASLSYSDTAFTAEIGAKFNLMKRWTAEPAIRVATFDEPLYELRLDNQIHLTEAWSIEANIAHRAMDLGTSQLGELPVLKEMNFRLGARYQFNISQLKDN
ncbi:outer membrane beta-barrel protein [Photobacterium rosenbergii]|uniref:outer membrane beta-barrel protein n=1 Tax=Photobacterium rosenbergii TaxID=294936 RepID=UPI001C9A13B5|nr:outer membrane beta-barrel protein [Photobacterium rosenbergii]MBY5946098.1 porin family protein [Photobacterium rosenbergii]